MRDNCKEKVTYTKDMLIKQVARKFGNHTVEDVREIYHALEDELFKVLSSATSDTDVSVRLFEGIVIDSSFVPEKKKVNNLTGETIVTTSKIKPKANITRNYCEKLTGHIK